MTAIIKRAARLVSRTPAFHAFVSLLERLDDRRPNLLRVLAYHRIDSRVNTPHLDPHLISATPEEFRWQVRHLASHYSVVSAAEVLDQLQHDKPLPPRSVLLTFDDAYRDFARQAWPILQEHHLPATLFVPTAYPDDPQKAFWWDRLYRATHATTQTSLRSPAGRLPLTTPAERAASFRQLRDYIKTLPGGQAEQTVEDLCAQARVSPEDGYVLGWDELRGLAQAGVTLGVHTRTHPLLNRIPIEQARAEVLGAVSDLRREIGVVMPILAYPAGGYDPRVVRMLREEGFIMGLTMDRGVNDLPHIDPLQLRRIYVGPRTTRPLLRVQLLPWTARRSTAWA